MVSLLLLTLITVRIPVKHFISVIYFVIFVLNRSLSSLSVNIHLSCFFFMIISLWLITEGEGLIWNKLCKVLFYNNVSLLKIKNLLLLKGRDRTWAKVFILILRGGGRSRLHMWIVMWRSWVRNPIKGPRCFLEPLLLSTGWFQEQIRAWYHNRTKINWGPYGKLT